MRQFSLKDCYNFYFFNLKNNQNKHVETIRVVVDIRETWLTYLTEFFLNKIKLQHKLPEEYEKQNEFKKIKSALKFYFFRFKLHK